MSKLTIQQAIIVASLLAAVLATCGVLVWRGLLPASQLEVVIAAILGWLIPSPAGIHAEPGSK